MEKDVTFFAGDGILSVNLPAEIDHHVAKPIREMTDMKLFELSPKVLVMDFSSVSFMDSSGIGLIIGRAAKAETVCASVEVRGLSPRLEKIVRMAGIERIPNVNIN